MLAKRDADQVTGGGNAAKPVAFEGGPSQTQAAGQQDRVLSYVSFGVAAAAAAGAVGFWIWGGRLDCEAASQLAIAPAISPTGGGLVLAGRF